MSIDMRSTYFTRIEEITADFFLVDNVYKILIALIFQKYRKIHCRNSLTKK